MSNKAIEYLLEYPISTEKVTGELDSDEAAALSVLSYAVTEANTLSRLYLFGNHKPIGIHAVDSAILIQQLVLLRTISSKIFEAVDFLSFGGRKKLTSNSSVLELAAEALREFRMLEGRDGYKIARAVRHEASHHYSFSAAKKNLHYLNTDADLTMYIHKLNGNSFYPMGEEVMFFARMNRLAPSLNAKMNRIELLEEWFDWIIDATTWLKNTHFEFHKTLIMDRFSEGYGIDRNYWIPPALVGSPDEKRVPVFLRVPREEIDEAKRSTP